MKGRKPKPPAVRRRDGNPGKRPIPVELRVGDMIEPGRVPPPPEHLPEAAAEVWREILPEIAEVGLARTIDLPYLEALSTHVAISRRALRELGPDFEEAVSITEKGTPVVSPWHRIYRDSWAEALKIGEQYGLSPIARTRLGIAAAQAKSLADELRGVLDADVVDAEVVEPKALPKGR